MTARLDPWELWEPDEYVPTRTDLTFPKGSPVNMIEWQGSILRLNAESDADVMLTYPDSFAIKPDTEVELWLQVDETTDLKIGRVTSSPWYEQRHEGGVMTDVLCVAGELDYDAVVQAMPNLADQIMTHQPVPVAVSLADAVVTMSGSVAILSGPWNVVRLTLGNWVDPHEPGELKPGGWAGIGIWHPESMAAESEEPSEE